VAVAVCVGLEVILNVAVSVAVPVWVRADAVCVALEVVGGVTVSVAVALEVGLITSVPVLLAVGVGVKV
jgi:hypothetical protein